MGPHAHSFRWHARSYFPHEEIDLAGVVDNAERMKNRTILKRLGYTLEVTGLLPGYERLFARCRPSAGLPKLDALSPRTGKHHSRGRLLIDHRLDPERGCISRQTRTARQGTRTPLTLGHGGEGLRPGLGPLRPDADPQPGIQGQHGSGHGVLSPDMEAFGRRGLCHHTGEME